MGIFDRAIRRGVGKALGESLSSAVNSALRGSDAAGNEEQPRRGPAGVFCTNCGSKIEGGARFCTSCGAKAPQSAEPVSAAPRAVRGERGKDYFASILSQDFSAYDVRENVSPAELGGGGKSYDFGLYQAGRLVGVVMLTPHNRDRNQAFLSARQTCQRAGIPFINFYTHMPNERGYVADRIRSML